LRFFWRRRIGAMADHRHHGEGEHHQRDVAMPPMPGSALVVIEPELVFRGLKTVLNRPSMAFYCVEWAETRRQNRASGASPIRRCRRAVPQPFDSPADFTLQTVPRSWQLRTVGVREGPFSMAKSHLKLVAPTEVNRTVAPTRPPNAELRT
jgi:hypothetical protein